MNETANIHLPNRLPNISEATQRLHFMMASDLSTGCLLRTLAAAKPAGNMLEIGTGTGAATAWLLDGMDEMSRLVSIESDKTVLAVAREFLDDDPRIVFHHADAGGWLAQAKALRFDLIFADAWPGKYSHLDEALRLLKRGGLYVIDDMLPQPNWPAGHGAKVEQLIATLEQRNDLRLTKLNWSTGIIIAAKAGKE